MYLVSILNIFQVCLFIYNINSGLVLHAVAQRQVARTNIKEGVRVVGGFPPAAAARLRQRCKRWSQRSSAPPADWPSASGAPLVQRRWLHFTLSSRLEFPRHAE